MSAASTGRRPGVVMHVRGPDRLPEEKQRGITIDRTVIEGANHFFEKNVDELMTEVSGYLDKRLGRPEEDAA